jgi:RNA polymerase sigma-70 factor, ECF subfamily
LIRPEPAAGFANLPKNIFPQGETRQHPPAYQRSKATRNGYPVLTESGILDLVRDNRRDEAIAALLPQYRRKVFGLAYSFLRNRDAAEDVTQEVFIKVWRALPSYDGRASMSTWIYTITRNTSLSALRTQRPHSSLSDPEVMAQIDTMDETCDAGTAVDAASLLKKVDQLPDKQRRVVMLFYMQEQSHEEVAAMLAMPIGTVKTLLHRARARLGALT